MSLDMNQFNNVYYVDSDFGNDTNLGTSTAPLLTITKAVSLCNSTGDAIVVKGTFTGDVDISGKTLSIIGNESGSILNGRYHGSSNSYAIVNFYKLIIQGPGGSGWTEQFYYINATVYNCVYTDLSGYSCVYGTYKFNNCLIIQMASPYSGATYTNCAFVSSSTLGTVINCVASSTYNSTTYFLTNQDNSAYGVYSGNYVWEIALSLESIATISPNSDLRSTSAISYYFDILSNSLILQKQDLQSILTIRNSQFKELLATINVRQVNDISSTAVKAFFNELDITYLLKCMEDFSTIESCATVSFPTDLESSAMLRAWAHAVLVSSAQISKFRDLLSTGYTPYIEDLLSNANLTETNLLDILYKLIQAPINTIVCTFLQDSYIRESRPTLNYGTAESLTVGHPLEGKYTALIEFDLSKFNNLDLVNNNLISLNLVLSLTGSYSNGSKLNVYSITTSWNENTVTWSNFTAESKTLIASSDCKPKVEINIYDYCMQLRNNKSTAVNLLIEIDESSIDDFISIESNNSQNSTSRPRLEVKYQDNNWIGYTEFTDLGSTVQIRAHNSKDLESTSRFRNTNNIDIQSNTYIPYHKDLNSFVVKRLSSLLDLDASSEMLPGTSLESSVTIRRTENKDLEFDANIYFSGDIDSIVDIKTSLSWLDSLATIRNTKELDLGSKAVIFFREDLASTAKIVFPGNTDLLSSSIIRSSGNLEISSIVNINNTEDIRSIGSFRKTSFNDLSSYAKSRWSDLYDINSTAIISSRIDLPSTALKRGNKNLDLNCYLNSAYGISLNSTVNIISLLPTETIDVLSSSIIRAKGHEDLVSSASVSYYIDLLSQVSVKVQRDSLLDSQAKIRLTKEIDLVSQTIMRQMDIIEVDCSAYIMGGMYTQLESKASISRLEYSYLNSICEIKTSARQWVPNDQGKDIFSFKNRKLPRIWKRENFIKD